MRIGTWNIATRRPTDRHVELLCDSNCDAWLLTEINPRWESILDERCKLEFHKSEATMGGRQHWAGVACRQSMKLEPLRSPHPASVLARCNGITMCASILPWRGAEAVSPWVGASHAIRVQLTLEALLKGLPCERLVWGGDWNHALEGFEIAGNKQGRTLILKAIEQLNLEVPTRVLPARVNGFKGKPYYSIDHIAVPASWSVRNAEHITAKGLSDHDAYIVEVDAPGVS